MRIAIAAAAALFVVVATAPAGARAQIPSPPSGPRFEIAEARGLADVPARADAAFASSTAGPSFAAGTKAVVVKFQSAAPPSDAGLAISWTIVDGPKPVTVSTRPLSAGDLSSGAYDMLSNGSSGLAPGRYQVSVVGAAGRIYRTLEFSVLALPPVRARPATTTPGGGGGATDFGDDSNNGTARVVAYTLGDLELNYPADYSLSPVDSGSGPGVFLMRQSPKSALFVAYKTGGARFDLERDARPFVVSYFRAIHASNPGIATESRALPTGDLVGRPALGRVLIFNEPSGKKIVVTVYTFVVDGKNVYAGYIAPTAQTTVGIEGSAGDTTSSEFFRLVRTVNRKGAKAAPAVEETPSPTRTPRERRLHANPDDVAAVRPR